MSSIWYCRCPCTPVLFERWDTDPCRTEKCRETQTRPSFLLLTVLLVAGKIFLFCYCQKSLENPETNNELIMISIACVAKAWQSLFLWFYKTSNFFSNFCFLQQWLDHCDSLIKQYNLRVWKPGFTLNNQTRVCNHTLQRDWLQQFIGLLQLESDLGQLITLKHYRCHWWQIAFQSPHVFFGKFKGQVWPYPGNRT